VVATTDYNNMKNVLAAETSNLIYLYNLIRSYDQTLTAKFSELIDDYLIHAFDFEIIDYTEGTENEFNNIIDAVNDLSYNENKSSIHQNIEQAFENLIGARQQLIILGTKSLSLFQWVVLAVLGMLVVFSLYGLRDGSLFFDLITVLISSSIVLIFFLIRDIDLYIWNEQTFGFDIFENVFKAIGKKPYYPKESVTSGRIKPVDAEYRTGEYIDYPQSRKRKIEFIKKDQKIKTSDFDHWK
jgi:hypothetical protein